MAGGTAVAHADEGPSAAAATAQETRPTSKSSDPRETSEDNAAEVTKRTVTTAARDDNDGAESEPRRRRGSKTDSAAPDDDAHEDGVTSASETTSAASSGTTASPLFFQRRFANSLTHKPASPGSAATAAGTVTIDVSTSGEVTADVTSVREPTVEPTVTPTALDSAGLTPTPAAGPRSPLAPGAPPSRTPLADLAVAAFRAPNASQRATAASTAAASTIKTVATVPLGAGAAPYYVVTSPKGDRTYVVTTSVTGGTSLPTSTVIGVNTATNAIVGTGLTVGYVPISGLATTVKPIAFSPNGQRVYIASVTQDAAGAMSSAVTVIDAATGRKVGSPIALSSALGATGLVVSPDGGRLYTANSDGTVSVFDLKNGNVRIGQPISIGSTTAFGGAPADIAIATNNAQTVYISDWAEHAVYVLDASTNTVNPDPIKIDGSPVSLALSPDNSRLIVNSMRFDGVGPSTNQATVTVIDTRTNTVVGQPIAYGGVTSGFSTTGAMLISPDGRYVYTPSIVSASAGTSTATLWKIDTVSRTVAAVPALGLPLALSSDGRRLYVLTAPADGTAGAAVAVIDTATNATLGTTSLAGYSSLQASALSPDGTRLYVGDYTVAGTDIATLTGELTVINTGASNPVPPQPKPPLLQVVTKVLDRVETAVDNAKKVLQKRVDTATARLTKLQTLVNRIGGKIERAVSRWDIPALFNVVSTVHGVASDILEITKKSLGRIPGIFGSAVGVANLGNTIKELEQNLEVALTGGNGDLFKGIGAFVKSLFGVAQLTTTVAAVLYGGTATAAAVAVVDLFVVGASVALEAVDRALR
ncbi:DNA-binding beta-propeller fold protein YncE [Mycobacterium sp. BK558]|nr:DNA-binding beta-propeller fold protein YncE [Mycobacterium sp. BK558]